MCVFDLFLYTRFLYGFLTYFSSVLINNQSSLKGSLFQVLTLLSLVQIFPCQTNYFLGFYCLDF